jgi:23S rRNA (uracil1939-C5)-methyltransferase
LEAVLTMREIGARGDAVAAGEDGPVYAAYALPGEVVRARVLGDRAEVVAVESPSPDRVAPVCRHFGRCGGCQLQHWAQAPYLDWKREQVVSALARRGIEAPVSAIIPAFEGGRRRAAFHGARAGKTIKVGFVERGGARIGPILECPVLAPGLSAALPALAALTQRFGPEKGALTFPTLLTDTGLDIDVKGAGRVAQMDRAALEDCAAIAREHDLARLSFDGEPAATLRPPRVRMGQAIVQPPPGAFLQATAAGEAVLGALVQTALKGAERAADLFSGIGTFALRLAQDMEVLAVEGDEAMLAALKAAADGVGGLRGVQTTRRDLLRQPLSWLELKRFDSVVFDPPRSGAKLQAEQIARSKATKVAAVSCDPATFARDVRVLIDAGFSLVQTTPVDQFHYSPHVEIVGVLQR